MGMLKSLLRRPFFIRLFNWEYWPFAAVYYPVFPVWVILCLRARAVYFFNASNPGIENGGLLNESKKDIHAILPDDLYPRTKHFHLNSDPEIILSELKANGFAYPLFGKPDVGGRGRGVKKMMNERDLENYIKNVTLDFHIQEMVPWTEEVGIFYYRLPGKKKGRITGIVKKEFLTVTGNGTESIYSLLIKDKRGAVYAEKLKSSLGEENFRILPAGEKKIVSPYGNHARGSKFVDITSQSDSQLEETFDRIASRIPGFYFGRLDVCYRDWESLKEGRDFQIIEVNGAGAEPTHMYDPAHSIFFAWKEIVRHWWIMATVSIHNHREGCAYLTIAEGRAVFRRYSDLNIKIDRIPS